MVFFRGFLAVIPRKLCGLFFWFWWDCQPFFVVILVKKNKWLILIIEQYFFGVSTPGNPTVIRKYPDVGFWAKKKNLYAAFLARSALREDKGQKGALEPLLHPTKQLDFNKCPYRGMEVLTLKQTPKVPPFSGKVSALAFFRNIVSQAISP